MPRRGSGSQRRWPAVLQREAGVSMTWERRSTGKKSFHTLIPVCESAACAQAELLLPLCFKSQADRPPESQRLAQDPPFSHLSLPPVACILFMPFIIPSTSWAPPPPPSYSASLTFLYWPLFFYSSPPSCHFSSRPLLPLPPPQLLTRSSSYLSKPSPVLCTHNRPLSPSFAPHPARARPPPPRLLFLLSSLVCCDGSQAGDS